MEVDREVHRHARMQRRLDTILWLGSSSRNRAFLFAFCIFALRSGFISLGLYRRLPRPRYRSARLADPTFDCELSPPH
jgi:hypothetical protein